MKEEQRNRVQTQPHAQHLESSKVCSAIKMELSLSNVKHA